MRAALKLLTFLLLTAPAAAEVHRLGDCAVFPPAPVHVIHRPHHFAHHRPPVCRCQDELGGPAGSGAPGDGFSLNNYGGNGDGGISYAGDGAAGFGGGDIGSVGPVGGLLFVGSPVVLSYVFVGLVGKGDEPPGGPNIPPGSVIPEPSTLALVALGAGALLLKWRLA